MLASWQLADSQEVTPGGAGPGSRSVSWKGVRSDAGEVTWPASVRSGSQWVKFHDSLVHQKRSHLDLEIQQGKICLHALSFSKIGCTYNKEACFKMYKQLTIYTFNVRFHQMYCHIKYKQCFNTSQYTWITNQGRDFLETLIPHFITKCQFHFLNQIRCFSFCAYFHGT